ncbi:hypothetical protein EN802_22145 [bacterium M00.F.Ca.ET.159.01.1.1]|nr:hypothetical protein EN873_27385 [bacterium M00.F.Ca.ET.230.01.1.1]TGT71001.1 hypothetical protein EN802_22145 [bacterium M00.F.Ca.ET.159.01.1.1]TGT82644.1 hypothetical protein EN800_20305 [bacterium M00.F.Ca.ET.157.01.1.1]
MAKTLASIPISGGAFADNPLDHIGINVLVASHYPDQLPYARSPLILGDLILIHPTLERFAHDVEFEG